jgi:hypothetical protein
VLLYISKISKGYKEIIEKVFIAILLSFKKAPYEMYENVAILVH